MGLGERGIVFYATGITPLWGSIKISSVGIGSRGARCQRGNKIAYRPDGAWRKGHCVLYYWRYAPLGLYKDFGCGYWLQGSQMSEG